MQQAWSQVFGTGRRALCIRAHCIHLIEGLLLGETRLDAGRRARRARCAGALGREPDCWGFSRTAQVNYLILREKCAPRLTLLASK